MAAMSVKSAPTLEQLDANALRALAKQLMGELDETRQLVVKLNQTGNRGGCLVKVKQISQREPRAVDNNALRPRPVAHRQSIQATVDG